VKSYLSRSFLVVLIMLLFLPALLFSVEKTLTTKRDLVSGRIISGRIDLSDEGQSYQTYKFKVNEGTFAARISLSNSSADLDIFVKRGTEIQSYDLVDYYGTEEDFNESILITRLSELPLEDDIYYVDISYQRDILPIIDGKKSTSISYNIVLELEEYQVTDSLVPGISSSFELYPDKGMATLLALKVPENTNTFRIDLFNTTSDLDLMVSFDDKIISRSRNDFLGESLLGKETLIIEGIENNPVETGIYYILVFDQIANDQPTKFSILTGLNRFAPRSLTTIPRLPTAGNEMQNVLSSTVEVIGNAGKGSGCFVSSSGHIITNWHVIEDFTGEVSKEIYVAVNLSNELPPEELFKAKLIDYSKEKDLALLQISSGLYGNSIPFAYTFPFFSLGNTDSLTLGQPLTYLGYPGIGGTGSRASISMTRGIVSGFERSNGNLLIKTDAEINSGNSGGAAINTFYELIGFPTSTIEEDAGQLGYLTPISMIPKEWQRYMGR
jgi:S1-C subfamily serine protease